jgi:cytochrome c-type biogenesis protein CcmF
LKDTGLFAPISREGGLLLNNLFLCVAAGIVFFGTLFPLFASAFGYAVTVGPPFFNLIFGILMAPFLCLVPFGPMLAWKRADVLAAAQRLWVAAAAAAVAFALLLYAAGSGKALAALGLSIAAWLVVGAFAELADRVNLFRMPFATSWRRIRNIPRASLGMTLAHGGLGVVVAGIVAISAWRTEQITVMQPSQSVAVGEYRILFEGVRQVAGPNYTAERGAFVVERDGREVARMYPEKRFYPVQGQATTEAAIRTTGVGDLYVVLGDDQGDGSRAVRIFHNPLAPWLWAGAIIMVVGGLVSLTDRRYRLGVPGRRRQSSTATAAGTNA